MNLGSDLQSKLFRQFRAFHLAILPHASDSVIQELAKLELLAFDCLRRLECDIDEIQGAGLTRSIDYNPAELTALKEEVARLERENRDLSAQCRALADANVDAAFFVEDNSKVVENLNAAVQVLEGEKSRLAENAEILCHEVAALSAATAEAALILDEKDGALADLEEEVSVVKAQAAEIYEKASRDHLTGLANRGALNTMMDEALSRARRDSRALAVIFVDLDRFKQLNDRHGHLVGDEALKRVGELLRQSVRAGDGLLGPAPLAGRFGGEEFVIVLPEVGATAAQSVAERVRRAIGATTVTGADGLTAVPLSASLGVAVLDDGDRSMEDLLDRADHALYRAKKNGRDRVEFAEALRTFDTMIDEGDDGPSAMADLITLTPSRMAPTMDCGPGA